MLTWGSGPCTFPSNAASASASFLRPRDALPTRCGSRSSLCPLKGGFCLRGVGTVERGFGRSKERGSFLQEVGDRMAEIPGEGTMTLVPGGM